MGFLLYSIVGCPHCARARAIFKTHRLHYEERSLDAHPEAIAEMQEKSGWNVLPPQIFHDDIHIGSVEELEHLLTENTRLHNMQDQANFSQSSSSSSELPSPQFPASSDENGNHAGRENETSSTADDGWSAGEFVRLVADMKKANLIRDNRVGLVRVYRNSFKGEHFIEWLIHERDIKRKEALEIAQDLIDRRLGQQTSREMGDTFSPDRYYQLVEDDENKPLNTCGPSCNQSDSVAGFNQKLATVIQPIYDEILSENNRTICYYKLVENESWARYLELCRRLQKVNLSGGTPDEKLALLLNVFNMMLIHITQKYGPPTSVWQRRKFFNSTYYTIDGHNYSLQSISNGILRSNRKGRDMLWKPFGDQDKRLPLILPAHEPLIHFAMLTGDRSTPPLRVYTCQNVRRELQENARRTLKDKDYIKIDTKKKIVFLSKVFKWYAEDFGSTTNKILAWILDVTDCEEDEKDENQSELQKMFYTGEYKVDYLHHDSTFNGVEKDAKRVMPAVDCRLRAQSDALDSAEIPPPPLSPT